MSASAMKIQQKIIISKVTQCNKKLLKTSANGGYVPIDLLIDIFSRLPAKSIARCRCISKTWDSMLRLPSFTELFMTRSLTRPRLLFACHNKFNNEVSFFSSTQPQIVDDNLSLLTASYHMKIPYNFKFERFSPIRGLVFLENKRSLGRVQIGSVICNPSTRQSWTLPKVNSRRRIGVRSYFGYDPVEKQYKVLSMTWKVSYRNVVCEEHQVMTLGSRESSWRMIECPIPHCSTLSKSNQICINGVLYYTAYAWVKSSIGNLIIICFDVKFEKFSFIKCMESTLTELDVAPLINCNGKLGSLSSNFTGHSFNIMMWVLEDVEKQEWVKHTYVLPYLWKNTVGNLLLCFVGVTRTKEFVLSMYSQKVPYYIFFYNMETKTTTKVEIQGMKMFKFWDIYTYLDHIEDVKLLQM